MLLQEEENVEEPKAKRARLEEDEITKQKQSSDSSSAPKNIVVSNGVVLRRIETGYFSQIPPELFNHILKFLSSEVTSWHFFFVRVWKCVFLIVFN